VTKRLNLPLVEGAKVTKLEKFNAVCYGGKVSKQTRTTLEGVLEEGERK
jgi:hypothetical protein